MPRLAPVTSAIFGVVTAMELLGRILRSHCDLDAPNVRAGPGSQARWAWVHWWAHSRQTDDETPHADLARPGRAGRTRVHRSRAGTREAEGRAGGRWQEPAVLPAADDRRVARLLQIGRAHV